MAAGDIGGAECHECLHLLHPSELTKSGSIKDQGKVFPRGRKDQFTSPTLPPEVVYEG